MSSWLIIAAVTTRQGIWQTWPRIQHGLLQPLQCILTYRMCCFLLHARVALARIVIHMLAADTGSYTAESCWMTDTRKPWKVEWNLLREL